MYTKLENEVISKVVDGLYRVLLGREPDESGHDFHFNNIMANYKSGAFEEVLRGFISSKEIYESNLEKYRNSELKKFGEEIKNIYEDNVFSLGTHCYTSYMLKVAGLKVFSGPFDWLFSSCSLIEDCFSDNFEKFLDKSFYETVPIDKRAHQHVKKCDHRYFKEKYGINYVFNHRDPSGDKDYNYYVRCVERLIGTMESGRKTLLVCTLRDNLENHLSFLSMARKILEKSSNIKIVGAAITDNTEKVPKSVSLYNDNKINLFRYESSSKWLDIRFSSPTDDINLFKHICSVACEAK